jgi:hypothetical protein
MCVVVDVALLVWGDGCVGDELDAAVSNRVVGVFGYWEWWRLKESEGMAGLFDLAEMFDRSVCRALDDVMLPFRKKVEW